MTKKVSTPALRFKGFTYTWKQRKLSDQFSDFIVPMRDKPKKFGGNIPWTRIEDIEGKYLNGSLSGQFVSKDTIKQMNLKIIPKDSLIVSSSATFGVVAIITQDLITNQTFIGLVPNDKETLDFWYTFFHSNEARNYMRLQSAGSTIFYIAREHFEKMPIIIPFKDEMITIGKYFSNLDRLITLHQRKYDKLTNMKKSMLEKMFPKNGANVPEIRFKGFTDAWEQRKLGDIVQITMGQSPDGSTYSDVPSDYILVQGNADLQNGWVCPKVWTSQMTKKADAGDLIMSVRAPAGTMGKTTYNVVIGRGVAAIKGNDFIYQLLVKMDIDGFWKALSCGSTFESLNTGNIKNAEVLIPDIDEQEKIGQYFTNLDHLITLHQRELEKLKNLKKACLEKMFV